MRSFTAAWQHPGQRRLLAAYALNEIADSIVAVALAVAVFDRTGSATLTALLFLAMKGLPAVISPGAVALLDGLPSRVAFGGTYLAEGAALAVLAAIIGVAPSGAVIALAGLAGALTLSARVLCRTTIAQHARAVGRLRETNAVISGVFSVAATLGSVAGGLLVASTGAAGSLLIAAGIFAGLAVVLAARPLPAVAAVDEADRTPVPWRTRLREGTTYLRADRELRVLLWAEAVGMLTLTAIVPAEVVYAKEVLDVGDGGYGALLAVWAAGIAAGAGVFAVRRHAPMRPLAAQATLLMAVAAVGMAVTGSLWVALAFAFVGGIGNGVRWAAMITAIQELVADALLARVSGLFDAVSYAATGAGYVLGGLLTTWASARFVYWVAGVGALFSAVQLLLIRPRARAGTSLALGLENGEDPARALRATTVVP
jgi:MFS family permease